MKSFCSESNSEKSQIGHKVEWGLKGAKGVKDLKPVNTHFSAVIDYKTIVSTYKFGSIMVESPEYLPDGQKKWIFNEICSIQTVRPNPCFHLYSRLQSILW